MASPMPRLPPVTSATRAMGISSWVVYSGKVVIRWHPDAQHYCAADFAFEKKLQKRGAHGAPDICAIRLGSVALHTERNAHAAPDTERGKAFLGIASLHFEQQRVQDTRAGGTDRVTDGDGTAVDVHD